MTQTPRLARLVDLATLDGGPTRIKIETNEAERAEIARRLDLPSLTGLSGEFDLTPTAAGVDILISVKAVAERACVVSLEMFTETVDERFKLRLERRFDDESESDGDDDDWTREPLESEVLDLGEILVQHLSLALDPHPRKPGAKSLLEDFRDAASPSPFAVLKGMVDRDG